MRIVLRNTSLTSATPLPLLLLSTLSRCGSWKVDNERRRSQLLEDRVEPSLDASEERCAAGYWWCSHFN